MAGIDKTYLTRKQYIEVRNWYIENLEKQKIELGTPIYLHPFYTEHDVDFDEVTEEYMKKNTSDVNNFKDGAVAWNTSNIEDIWLSKNCKLPFVQQRLVEQYGKGWSWFTLSEKLDFNETPRLVRIYDDNSMIYFFDSDKKYIDNFIVYGTTYFYKLLKQTIEVCSGYSKKEDIKVDLMFYGLEIEYKNGGWFYDNNYVHFPFINEFREVFELPEFKHSYKISDSKNMKPDSIILSKEDSCHDIAQYENHKEFSIKRYMFELPDYIHDMIIDDED